MRFYEINEPYYSMIKAEDDEQAVRLYIEVVAGEDNEFDEIVDNCEIVADHIAIVKFARALGENGELILIEEVIGVLESNNPEVLLIDGSLL